MAKDFVILSEAPNGELPRRLEDYIGRHFPEVKVERRDYHYPGGSVKGNIVAAEVFLPIPDYETVLRVIRAEDNRVFILSEGISNNQDGIKKFGIEGVIYALANFKHNYLEGFIRWGSARPAAEILKGYVAAL